MGFKKLNNSLELQQRTFFFIFELKLCKLNIVVCSRVSVRNFWDWYPPPHAFGWWGGSGGGATPTRQRYFVTLVNQHNVPFKNGPAQNMYPLNVPPRNLVSATFIPHDSWIKRNLCRAFFLAVARLFVYCRKHHTSCTKSTKSTRHFFFVYSKKQWTGADTAKVTKFIFRALSWMYRKTAPKTSMPKHLLYGVTGSWAKICAGSLRWVSSGRFVFCAWITLDSRWPVVRS